jgi:3-methylcrotonyl-CoA carboxylase alpha subunit
LAAAVHRLLRDEAPAAAPGDPHSPWALATAWRLNGDGYQDFELAEGEARHELRAHILPGGFRLGDDRVHVNDADGVTTLRLGDSTFKLRVLRQGQALTVFLNGVAYALMHIDPRAPLEDVQAGGGRILAPMPGRVLDVLVREGEAVTRGQVLLMLEAMKVQMRITAPADGTVISLRCAAGDLVEDGTELVTLD